MSGSIKHTTVTGYPFQMPTLSGTHCNLDSKQSLCYSSLLNPISVPTIFLQRLRMEYSILTLGVQFTHSLVPKTYLSYNFTVQVQQLTGVGSVGVCMMQDYTSHTNLYLSMRTYCVLDIDNQTTIRVPLFQIYINW